MDYGECLRSCSVKLAIESDTKEGIITEMVDLLHSEGKINDEAAVLKAVLDREAQMSTGMQYGVAIPHGKTAAVDRIVTVVALKKEGVDFASLDGKPSKIFIMTVSSTLMAGPHIEFLSEVSRILTKPSVRTCLLKARTRDDVLSILAEE